MKKIFSILFAVVLALSLIAVVALASPVKAESVTIEVSQPTYLTTNGEYDRNPSIVYDGTNYWLFWTKADNAAVRGTGTHPDGDTYVVYYKTATTIGGLAGASETKLGLSEASRPGGFTQRVVSVTYFGGKVYAFVSSGQDGTDRGLYYYVYSVGSWSGPSILITDTGAPNRGGHVNVVSDSNRVYIVWECSDGTADAYTWDPVSGLSGKIDISNDNQPKITLMGTTLYVVSIEDGTGDIEVYSAAAGASPSFTSHSTAISGVGLYDPCIFNDGTDLYVVTAPYVGGNDQQYLIQTKYDTSTSTWATDKTVNLGGYGGTYWWDYWPIGYWDGSDPYVFFTTETSSPTYSDAEIAFIKMDWDLGNDHYFYIQNAIDAASSTTINVAAGTYDPFTVVGKTDLTIQSSSVVTVQGLQVVTTNYTDRDAVVFVSDSTNIVLDGLVIGPNTGKTQEKDYGVIYENSSGEINNCTVSPDTSGDMKSQAIAMWDGSDVTIDFCTIEDFGRIGVFIYNDCTVEVLDSTIEGQVYSGEGEVCYGIEVEAATDDPSTACQVTIDGVEIYNCDNTFATGPSWESGGVYINGWLEYQAQADSTVTVKNCDIHDNYIGIIAIKSSLSSAHCNSIYDNRVYGAESVAAHDDSTAVFDASANWWGSNDPTTVAGMISGDVDFTPLLDSGTDTEPATPGFQPSLASLTVHTLGSQSGTTGRIQEGVNLVSSSTVNVAAGTYAGAIVNKEVTISGAPGGTSVINTGVPYKDGSSLTTAFRLDSGADGTEINNFTINNNQGASFYFAVFARGVNDVTIDNLEINDTVQGITNWGGSGWTITNNTVIDTVAAGGGGIAIFLGATPPSYRTCSDNLVQYNTIDASATAETYSCPGICLALDTRYGAYDELDGSEDISGNQILDNTITASGANNGVGIEVGTILGDSEEDPDRTDPVKIAAIMDAAAVDSNIVQDNTADGADMGIYFYNVTNLTITQNTVENSVGYGIYAEHGQSGTVIQGNTFSNNDVQLKDETVDTATLGPLDIATILNNNTFDHAVTVDHPGASLLHVIWSSIQDAIDAAVAGDTVNVAAGTYTEAVTITPGADLTIQGAGRDVTTWIAPADDPSRMHCIQCALSGYTGTTTLDISGFTFSVEDNAISNSGIAIYINKARTGPLYLDIHDNKFVETTTIPDETANSMLLCHNRYVARIGGVAPVKIHDNLDYTTGGIAMSNTQAFDIYSNTFDGGSDALYIGYGCPENTTVGDHYIYDNTFRNASNAYPEPPWPAIFFSYYGTGTGMTFLPSTIECNTFEENDVAIGYSMESDITYPADVIIFNNFDSNTEAVSVFGTYAMTVDARYNWWGDVSGPGGVGPGTGDPVSDYVLFYPWLHAEVVDCDPGYLLDHFKCYDVLDGTYLGEVVLLEDQFHDEPFEAVVESPEFFGNPADKWHDDTVTEIWNFDDHLTLYGLTPLEEEPWTWCLDVCNQFDSQEFKVSNPVMLAVPTRKAPHDPFVGPDHYLLYEVIEGEPLEVPVFLWDQFEGEPEVMVLQPVYFANPVSKDGGLIEDQYVHLVFYEIVGAPYAGEVWIENQFGMEILNVSNPALLAVPSDKINFAALCSDQIGFYQPSEGKFVLDMDGDGLWNGAVDRMTYFGAPNNTPIIGDWNGDGKDEIGFYRPSKGKFVLDMDGDGLWNAAVDRVTYFGAPNNTPIIGDWNGDGKDEIGFYRPSEGKFVLDMDGDGVWNAAVDRKTKFGKPDNTPIIGDWNGDGKDEIGFYRSSKGKFNLDMDGDGLWNAAVDRKTYFGAPNNTPIIGDWNGDGKDEIGFYRPSEGKFVLDMDGDGLWNGAVDRMTYFGTPNNTPIIGCW